MKVAAENQAAGDIRSLDRVSTTFSSGFFSVSGTKQAAPELFKEYPGDISSDARFAKGVGSGVRFVNGVGSAVKFVKPVKGVGSWSGAFSCKSLSGTAGPNRMLSSGAALDMGR